ncbi:hypothetical protein P1J78_14510 [Psychromarinibacter sp. C21-152]|uniref:Monooxygenase n=1 Tax=Psychromarinibacter sediminicola TaxID=3033385 RepID=A0AAE3NPU4_9RHOB|nr:hypothetical protein [Psychromarinibacter sediminicola]MDF0601953.1 hypothetical protein [Psychromarinibacter sediminicola]
MIEIVTFDLRPGTTREEVLAGAHKVADKWRAVPELVRKSFFHDPERGVAGAVYQWADPAAADRWHDAAWRASIVETYGSEPRVERYEMTLIADNELGKTEEYPAIR